MANYVAFNHNMDKPQAYKAYWISFISTHPTSYTSAGSHTSYSLKLRIKHFHTIISD